MPRPMPRPRPICAEHPAPDAVFCFSDTAAMAVISAFREAGHLAPRDYSLVGYNDIPPAAHFTPAITTIEQETHIAGAILVEKLMQQTRRRPRQIDDAADAADQSRDVRSRRGSKLSISEAAPHRDRPRRSSGRQFGRPSVAASPIPTANMPGGQDRLDARRRILEADRARPARRPARSAQARKMSGAGFDARDRAGIGDEIELAGDAQPLEQRGRVAAGRGDRAASPALGSARPAARARQQVGGRHRGDRVEVIAVLARGERRHLRCRPA